MDNQIFVKIEEYNEVLEMVKLVKEKIQKAQTTIEEISALKTEEEQELDKWNKSLETVTNNVEEIEQALLQTKEKNG